MKRFLFLTAIFVSSFNCYSADNLVFISMDGMRWQEVFNGADESLLNAQNFTHHPERTRERYWHDEQEIRRQKLMPFLWKTIAKQGQILGNPAKGQPMILANNWYFSYPGYNEMLTGKPDPTIDSNSKRYNPNVTFLEWLNQQDGFKNKIAAFASWDVFPYILNQPRSGLVVNAGFASAYQVPLTENEKLLNDMQHDTYSPWDNVRLDVFTYQYAKEHILKTRPRVIYISLGETDDFAHDGHYDDYLDAAHRDDQLIAKLWQLLQSLPEYNNNTTLLLTTDHGRGNTVEDWQHHASKQAIQGYMQGLKKFPNGIVGAERIWMAAVGPDIQPEGEVDLKETITLSQMTATAIQSLGMDWRKYSDSVAPPISF